MDFNNIKQNKTAKSLTYQFINSHYSIINEEIIEKLSDIALNLKETVRICMHSNANDDLHNMLIVHHKNSYIKPHANMYNSKAYHHIKGEMLIIGLDENQKEIFRTILNKYNKIVRIEKGIFLYMRILSEIVVFHEIAIGPYTNFTTIYPEWAPEKNEKTIQQFIKRIENGI